MENHLTFIGYSLLFLAIIHIQFPKRFNWKQELATLSPINREMMQVHTFFIALIVAMMGLLCISSKYDLINSDLGRRISWGLGIFWGIRFIFQLFVYSSILWKGKRFETIIHIIFSIFWFYLTFVFLYISYSK